MIALALSACLPRGSAPVGHAVQVDEVVPATPTITSADVTCDAETDTWSFTLETDAWTGGGWVWLSDGDYVEKTRIPSVAAARDGSSDRLELELSLKLDFRSSSGTVFPCAADPEGLLFVHDVDDEIADCRWFGPGNDVWDAIGQGGCEVPVD